MHDNPVKRKLVGHPRLWPWSSWSFYEEGEEGLIRIDVLKPKVEESQEQKQNQSQSQNPHPYKPRVRHPIARLLSIMNSAAMIYSVRVSKQSGKILCATGPCSLKQRPQLREPAIDDHSGGTTNAMDEG